MLAWIPEDPALRFIGPILGGVRVSSDPAEAEQAEFFVADAWIAEQTVEALSNMRSLKVVQTLSAGVDWLPELPDGVTLCDARGVHDIAVAEWVLSVILAATRRLPALVGSQLAERWERVPQAELHGSRVLILGYGSIGEAVEARLEPFGVEIDRVARSAREGVHSMDGLGELLLEADVVVLLVPLTDETRGMVDVSFLDRMKEGALLVNAARGPIVDTDALLAALRTGQVRAALDVTDPEPLPDGHPLWSAPGALITPHVGGDTPGFRPRAYRLVGDQIRRYAAGEPLINVVQGDY